MNKNFRKVKKISFLWCVRIRGKAKWRKRELHVFFRTTLDAKAFVFFSLFFFKVLLCMYSVYLSNWSVYLKYFKKFCHLKKNWFRRKQTRFYAIKILCPYLSNGVLIFNENCRCMCLFVLALILIFFRLCTFDGGTSYFRVWVLCIEGSSSKFYSLSSGMQIPTLALNPTMELPPRSTGREWF